MEYKLIDKETKKIALHGYVPEFTLGELENNIEILKKNKRELDANIKLQEAKKGNIEEHHPFVLHMEPEDIFTCHMYQETKDMLKKFTDMLERVEAQLKSDEEERDEVFKQIPELLSNPSAEVVDGEVKLHDKENN